MEEISVEEIEERGYRHIEDNWFLCEDCDLKVSRREIREYHKLKCDGVEN